MPEPVHPDNRAQPVALVVQLHAETVSRVDVTDVSSDNVTDHLISMAIGDDRSGSRPLGQLRDVHTLVVEADRQLTRRCDRHSGLPHRLSPPLCRRSRCARDCPPPDLHGAGRYRPRRVVKSHELHDVRQCVTCFNVRRADTPRRLQRSKGLHVSDVTRESD